MHKYRFDFTLDGVDKSCEVVGVNFQHAIGFLFTTFEGCILNGFELLDENSLELAVASSMLEVPNVAQNKIIQPRF